VACGGGGLVSGGPVIMGDVDDPADGDGDTGCDAVVVVTAPGAEAAEAIVVLGGASAGRPGPAVVAGGAITVPFDTVTFDMAADSPFGAEAVDTKDTENNERISEYSGNCVK
jgi:hypothetical protein